MLTLREYFDFDPDNKNYDWAMKKITHFRMNWGYLIPPPYAKEQMEILLGNHSMASVKKMFEEPDNANVDFTPKKILEKIRNILTAEVEDTPIRIEVAAVDATATTNRQKDKDLLSARGEMEQFISYFGRTIGKPKFKLANEKDTFAGNTHKFDEMGLDDTSADDLDYFFSTFYRLLYETKAEPIIAAYVGANELEAFKPMLVNDIMSKKALALHAYVNENTGSIDVKYIPPEAIRLIMGERPDGKDATCVGYERSVTVQRFISMAGSDFDWQTDMDALLIAVNYLQNLAYTGVGEGQSVMCGSGENMCSYSKFLSFKVSIGYIEWKEIDATAFKRTEKAYHGNPRLIKIKVKTDPPNGSIYSKELKYNEVTYKSMYLVLATGVQKLYRFGKLNYQPREGTEDEYSNYSICFYKGIGPSITEVARPHINKFEKAWAKRDYLINKAKEPGYMLNLDAILEVATKMVASGSAKADVMEVIEVYMKSPNMLYTTLNVNGEMVGGNGVPHHELKNGLAVETVQEFRKIIEECLADINDSIGVSPIRDAYAPSPRDGLKLQMQSLNYSRNATQYIDTMLTNVFNHVGIRIMSYIQDIIEFADHNTMPYKYMLNLLGDQNVSDIASMKKIPLHRYAIYTKSFTDKFEREEIKQVTQKALENGQILPEQLMLINSIQSSKEAAMTLAYVTRKNQRIKEADAQRANQAAMALQQQKHQNDMELEQLKSDTQLQGKNDEGRWYYLSHMGVTDEKTKQIALQEAAKVDNIANNAHAQMAVNEHSNNLQNQPPGGAGGAPQPGVSQSAAA